MTARSTTIAVAALAASTALGATQARAEIEVGGTAGIHVFSETNELGVADVTQAPSERNSALFGIRLGAFFGSMLGVEGEVGVIPSESRELVFSIWNLTYRGHLVAQFRAADPKNKLVPFVLLGGGVMSIVDSANEDIVAKDTDAMLYAGLGAKYRVDNNWGLRVDGRILFPPASTDESGPMGKASTSFTQDFEVLLSIYKEFGRKEAPKEKVLEPPVDNDPDKDQIVNPTDQCPNDPEDKDDFEDTDGCPDNDNDKDKVADAVDKCKNEPEDIDSFQDEDGCPDTDNDGDGILDTADKCANEAEDKDNFQDEDGCPDLDNDGDGVADTSDKCPNEAETKNGFEDDNGCPDELPPAVKKFSSKIDGINFKTGDATLLPTSNRTLDGAVKVLKEFGELKLEIGGHTDDVPLKAKAGAKFQDNDALSQGRADSVKAYLVSKGIAEDRLSTKGYGSSTPIENPAGLKGAKLNQARAKNRRVEFVLQSPLTAPATPTPPPPAPNP